MKWSGLNLPEARFLSPPADLPEVQRGNWFSLPSEDPVCAYLEDNLWDHSSRSASWQVARMSHAAYLYRECETNWAAVGKFYGVKKGTSAEKYAQREYDLIEQARESGLNSEAFRAVEPLAVWRGVLFLEYVPGLILEDSIAVRRSRPGSLLPAVEKTARLLGNLHRRTLQPELSPDFELRVKYIYDILSTLEKHGILQENNLTVRGVSRCIDRWASDSKMKNFTPVMIHGDATTTNFIYPDDTCVIAVDWERTKYADPASDLGRLLAEVTHSFKQHGGSVDEAEAFVQRIQSAYCKALSPQWDIDALLGRLPFYRA